MVKMKRKLSFLIFLTSVCALGWSQPKMTFDEKERNLGTILLNNPATTEFKITNTGSSPLVISNVTTSCACTVADWTKIPIQPGETGTIRATFDAKALGRFHKTVGIYSNADTRPTYLAFKGRVSTEINATVSPTMSFSYQIGKIGLDKNNIEFTEAHWGEILETEILLVNKSDKDYDPVLMHLPRYLNAEAYPGRIPKNGTGRIKLKLDTKQLKDYGLSQTSVYLARFPGDKVGEDNEILVSCVLLPDFSQLTEQQLANAPTIHLTQTEVDMGFFGTKDKLSHTITISNKGNTPLEIRQVQVFNSAVNVSLGKKVINPGGTTKLKVTLLRENLRKQKSSPRVLLITNDPKQPKVVVELNAEIQ